MKNERKKERKKKGNDCGRYSSCLHKNARKKNTWRWRGQSTIYLDGHRTDTEREHPAEMKLPLCGDGVRAQPQSAQAVQFAATRL